MLPKVDPLLRDARPAAARIRGLVHRAVPVAADLRPALKDLNAVTPHLSNAFSVLNYVVNEMGYNPPGPEEGYLFWTAWFFHNADSILSIEDAHGRRLARPADHVLLDAAGLPADAPELALLMPQLPVCPKDASALMVKQAPTRAKLAVMAFFALSCFGLLLFLWTSFGGPTPLTPKGYRVHVDFPEATQLADQADVRISGVPVGKVVALAQRGQRRRRDAAADAKYAPLARDARAILRTKTLLGETYVELSPGSRRRAEAPRGRAAARRRRSSPRPSSTR